MEKNFTVEEKRIRDIIIEWAKEKAAQDEIEFNEKYCCEKHISYRMKETTELIQEKSAENYNRNRFRIIYWNKPEPPYHYVYEIGIDSKENRLYLQLVFNYNSISDKTRRICDEILTIIKKYPPKDIEGTPYRISCSFKENIENCTDKNIKQIMDRLFCQMKEYVSSVASKVNRGKNTK